MSDLAILSNTVMDLVILICLIVAITLGSVLLWQILRLKRDQFRFDQMTKAMQGQMTIFQAALESGKLDLEVKIERMNKAITVAQNILDDMHALHATGQKPSKNPSNVTSIQSKKSPPINAKKPSREPIDDKDDGPIFTIMDPEFEQELKEDGTPAADDFKDLSDADRKELNQLGTPAEKALMAALKRAGRG